MLLSDEKREPELGERGGHRPPLLKGSDRGDQKAGSAAEERLQCLDSPTSHLEMGLSRVVGESFPLGEEEGRARTEECLEICFDGGCVFRGGGQGHHHAVLQGLMDGGEDPDTAGPDAPPQNSAAPGLRQILQKGSYGVGG